jgi:hypothetical protein
MPANFPEVWVKKVSQIFSSTDSAPWLDGIAELDVDVTEFGAGTPTELNVIHIPIDTLNPNVLINNTAYPIPVVPYADGEALVTLDKYQTEVVSLTDDQIMGASTDRIVRATIGLTRTMNEKKYSKAAHAMAPSTNTAATPVILATGPNVPSQYGGLRAQLLYVDLISMKGRLDTGASKTPKKGRRLVLSSEHYNDLLKDRENFGDIMKNYAQGTIAPLVAGFEIYEFSENAVFTAGGVKKAFGSVTVATDRQCSFVFLDTICVKKTGLTKQYFTKSETVPTIQTNQLSYRHYFLCAPAQLKYIGAIC